MPRIKEIPVSGQAPGPTRDVQATGAGFGTPVASGLDALGQGLETLGAGITKRAEDTETSALSASFSQTQADYTNKWQEAVRTAKPEDIPNLSQTFMEDFRSHMSEMKDGVSTRAGQLYFDKTASTLDSHFSTTTIAAQAELAGVQAKDNMLQTQNNLSSSLINDPSSFPVAKQLYDDSIENLVSSGQLPREKAIEMHTKGVAELAQGSIRGWIKNNPAEAQAQLQSGRWDSLISGDTKKQLYGEIDTEVRARRADARLAEIEAEKAKSAQQDITQLDFLKKMQEGGLTAKQVLDSNLENFGSGSKMQFINMIESSNRSDGKMKTDPGTFVTLFNRINSEFGTPGKIVDSNDLNQYLGNGLDYSALNQLRGEVDGKKTPAGQAAAAMKKQLIDAAQKSLVTKNLFGTPDQVGNENFLRFYTQFDSAWREAIKAGKKPEDLANPDSADSLVNMYKRFYRDPLTVMTDSARMMKGAQTGNTNAPPPPPKAVVPRLPGETIKQYRQRTGAF